MNTKTHRQTALVIAEPHNNDPGFAESRDWQNFLLNTTKNLPPAVKTERIAANCWLIPLDSDLHFFAALIQLLQKIRSCSRFVSRRLGELVKSIHHPPDKSPEPTAVIAVSCSRRFHRFHDFSRRWLSFCVRCRSRAPYEISNSKRTDDV